MSRVRVANSTGHGPMASNAHPPWMIRMGAMVTPLDVEALFCRTARCPEGAASAMAAVVVVRR